MAGEPQQVEELLRRPRGPPLSAVEKGSESLRLAGDVFNIFRAKIDQLLPAPGYDMM